ncbi:hypothetical protein FAM15333_001272 [Propionibacterium freudenreichii]|nr:hypothetical protein [Propionibacterium freudenreichii]
MVDMAATGPLAAGLASVAAAGRAAGDGALIALDINPPIMPGGWVWTLAAVLLLAAGLGAFGIRRAARRRAARARARRPLDLAGLRARALSEIDHVDADLTAGRIDARVARQQLSAIVRRFVGTAGNGDADFQSLAELQATALRDPALRPAAEFVAGGYQESFAAPGTGNATAEENGPATVDRALREARQVVRRWL